MKQTKFLLFLAGLILIISAGPCHAQLIQEKNGVKTFVIKKEASEYNVKLWRLKAEQSFEQTSFYQDFNFTVKNEFPVEAGNLDEFGIKKLILYTRPNDDSVRVGLFIDGNQYVKILSLIFRKEDPQHTLWVKAFLNECNINETTFGKYYPLDFIQGSVMQNITRAARLDLADMTTSYIINCVGGEKNFTVSIRKQSVNLEKFMYPEQYEK